MFDLAALSATVAAHGRVARVVIAGHDGSSPREVGAAMLVWAGGQSGSIGGGALEWEALGRARGMLAAGGMRLDRMVLGPNLGQCCGGAVALLTEVYGRAEVAGLSGEVIARAVDGRAVDGRAVGGREMPLAVARMLDRARAQGIRPAPALVQGWMVEPVARPARALWVWGAGHVGRAVVSVLAPLPDLAVSWVDVAESRFPQQMPDGVAAMALPDPEHAVAAAPVQAHHLILTYSHALDLELCHRLLAHGFASCGLIGSATKWARFRSRLAALGHAPGQIARIQCPIGDPAFGKHPQAIAIGVAGAFLAARAPAIRQEIAP